jgi:hypothetical protein
VLGRLLGVVTRPRRTFAAIAERPQWVAAMLILAAISFTASAAFLATDVGEQALVDQWERTSLAFGRPVDDAGYAELQRLSHDYRLGYAAATTAARGAGVALAVGAVLYGVLSRRERQPSFQQVLAVAVHAGVILVLRDLIAAPVNYVRESISSPLTALGLFGMLDEGSPFARFLALFDVFMVWWVVALAIGIGVLYGKRIPLLAAGFMSAYIVLAAALAGTMAVLGAHS